MEVERDFEDPYEKRPQQPKVTLVGSMTARTADALIRIEDDRIIIKPTRIFGWRRPAVQKGLLDWVDQNIAPRYFLSLAGIPIPISHEMMKRFAVSN